MVVLRLGCGGGRLDDFVNEPDAGLDFGLFISRDDTMHVLFFSIFFVAFALLDTTLATDRDLGTTFTLHLLETVAARSNEKAKEIDLRKLSQRQVNLFHRLSVALAGVILCRWLIVGIELELSFDELNALFLELFAISDFSRISPPTLSIIRRRR